MISNKPKYVIFSGGIGGAKLVQGFYESIPHDKFGVISNTGDDIIRFGLRICPDIDILLYTLSSIINKKFLWGLEGDTFNTLHALKKFYGKDSQWFNLGDKDFATHIFRTELLNQGVKLSKVTEKLRINLGVGCEVIPMAEGYLPTEIEIESGEILHFEEYFVKYKTEPKIKKIIYGGNKASIIPKKAKHVLSNAEKIIIAPSNPLLSIAPILKIPFYTDFLRNNKEKVIAVTPLIGNKAIKGPTVKNLESFEIEPNIRGICKVYFGLIGTLIVDTQDRKGFSDGEIDKIYNEFGIKLVFFDTIMSSLEKKKKLSEFIIQL